jgi:hypothetical protein
MPPAASYAIALGYFPQLLGFVYLLAFVSLLVQVKGLYGAQGILAHTRIYSRIGALPREDYGV